MPAKETQCHLENLTMDDVILLSKIGCHPLDAKFIKDLWYLAQSISRDFVAWSNDFTLETL